MQPRFRVGMGLVIIVLMMLPGSIVQAQPGGELAYGEIVTGTIGVGARHFWNFSAEAGDAVTIRADSEEFDTFLELLDPKGVVLSENDDGGEGSNARLIYQLPDAGTYTIIVSSFFNDEGGDYILSLEERQALPSGGALRLGEFVQAELWTAAGDRWTFEFDGEAGTTIVLEMNSDDFDSYLELFDADNRLIAENDDIGLSVNARIIIELTEPGSYTVVARGYHGGTGFYSLTVSDNVVQRQIAAGEAVGGDLDMNQIHFWRFTATAGNGVIIDMTSSDFDTYLELVGPDGEQVSENDDGGEGFNARLRYVATEDGTYTVIASSYDDFAVGDYTLILDVLEDVGPGGGAIAYGETITGELWVPDGDRWTFVGQAGDVVIISLNSDDFDAYLELYGAGGELLAEDDDGGGEYNSQLRYTLPESGKFVIIANSYSFRGTGIYTLELRRGTESDSSNSQAL